MKSNLIKGILYFAIYTFGISCMTSPNDKRLTNLLCGSWIGEDKGQQTKGLTRSWYMKRYDNGKYFIRFKNIVEYDYKTKEEFQQYLLDSIQNDYGYWFIEDGIYYESNNIEEPRRYSYKIEVISNNKIKFKSLKGTEQFNVSGYQFYDNRTFK